MPFSRKKLPLNPPPANELPQQPQPVCTWSAHAPPPGPSPFPLPRDSHTLTGTGTGTGDGGLLLFGGWAHGRASSDVYAFLTEDFSTTLLQTSGEVPTPRVLHGAAIIGTTLLICGGTKDLSGDVPLNHDTLYLLNLSTSDLLISNLTSADHSFVLQYRESGPAS